MVWQTQIFDNAAPFHSNGCQIQGIQLQYIGWVCLQCDTRQIYTTKVNYTMPYTAPHYTTLHTKTHTHTHTHKNTHTQNTETLYNLSPQHSHMCSHIHLSNTYALQSLHTFIHTLQRLIQTSCSWVQFSSVHWPANLSKYRKWKHFLFLMQNVTDVTKKLQP